MFVSRGPHGFFKVRFWVTYTRAAMYSSGDRHVFAGRGAYRVACVRHQRLHPPCHPLPSPPFSTIGRAIRIHCRPYGRDCRIPHGPHHPRPSLPERDEGNGAHERCRREKHRQVPDGLQGPGRFRVRHRGDGTHGCLAQDHAILARY